MRLNNVSCQALHLFVVVCFVVVTSSRTVDEPYDFYYLTTHIFHNALAPQIHEGPVIASFLN